MYVRLLAYVRGSGHIRKVLYDSLGGIGALHIPACADSGLSPAATAVSGRQPNSCLKKVLGKWLEHLLLSLVAGACKDCCKASRNVLVMHKSQRNKNIDNLAISQGAVSVNTGLNLRVVIFDAPRDCLREVEIAALAADVSPKDFMKSPALSRFKVQEDSEVLGGARGVIVGMEVARATRGLLQQLGRWGRE